MFIRLLDISISFIALVALLPLLACVSAILLLTGEHRVIYIQKRVGRHKQLFSLFKFATMIEDSPNIGAGAITLTNDPRVLPVGKLLRKTKINELPQLANILIGDMSFVGPRPLMEKQFAHYCVETQELVSSVRPGLTGVASLFFRNEERFFNNASDPQAVYRDKISPAKELLESWFLRHRGLPLYFKILFLTAAVVLLPTLNVDFILDNTTKVKLYAILER